MFVDPVVVSITQIILMTGLVNQTSSRLLHGERKAQISASSPSPSTSSRAKKLAQSCRLSPHHPPQTHTQGLGQESASTCPSIFPSFPLSPAQNPEWPACLACGSGLGSIGSASQIKTRVQRPRPHSWASSLPFYQCFLCLCINAAQKFPKPHRKPIPASGAFH